MPLESSHGSLDDVADGLQLRIDQLAEQAADKRQLASMTDEINENIGLQISAAGDEQLALGAFSQLCAIRRAQNQLNEM